jgi:hypothetical protein
MDDAFDCQKYYHSKYREKIGIIKTLHSSKLREIEELKNSNKVQEEKEEEGELPYISG